MRAGRPPAGANGERISEVKHTARLSAELDATFRKAAKKRGLAVSEAWRVAAAEFARRSQ